MHHNLGGADAFEPMSGRCSMSHAEEDFRKLVIASGNGTIDFRVTAQTRFRVRARARQICCLIEARSGTSSFRGATAIADALEDSIRDSGWVSGEFIGTETALAGTFEVGRRSIRQAGRILSARGTIEVRRGNAGGFLVSSVDQDAALSSLSAALGDISDIQSLANEACAMLPSDLLASQGPGASLARTWLQGLSTSAGRSVQAPKPKNDTRAQRIAHLIARECGPSGEDSPDIRIGSLDDLCERFSCGLPIMIQAIRILEDHGLATSRRGRAGGILLHAGGSSLAMRIVGAYLASHHANVEESDQLVRATTASAIELAHARISDQMTSRLDEHLARMEGCTNPTDLGLHWYLLQRTLCDTGSNPVLHLLARCFAGHVILNRARAADLSESQARTLMDASRTIVANIKCGTPGTSRDAHFRCQGAMMRSW